MNLRRLSAVSFGHMAIDILNASIAMILAVLAVDFHLSNAQIALGGMAYALMGSLTQPFFGVLADRLGGRWLGAVGLLWTAVFYYAATFAQDYFTLITLMTIASLGSGAFHPQGAMNAGAAGGPKATTGTSVFFLLGQLGLALGPMIVGVLLEEVWMLGPRIMAIATLPFVVWMALGLRKPLVRVEEEPPRPATLAQRRRRQERIARARAVSNSVAQPNRRWVALVAFAVLVALRASVHQIFYGMLPKYFADLGFTPTQFGFMVGVPSVAIALGSMAGGVLGDRYDQPKILLWSLLAATPFSWMMLDIVDGWVFYPIAFVAGFLVGIPHSILVVMAQRFLPHRQGLASGAILGFTFASGAVGMGVAGPIADFYTLSAVMHVVALMPLAAAFCAVFLRTRIATAMPVAPAAGSAD
ncbi:MAG: MFS transporter [Caldilineaceae bacterium SB0668_bin_21]|nr:MFS transporter [Caldilineaceae bacterium SB0668_bin_21]MYC23225.1 MFS transporter [Caldilineaceae bacterium SB0662_bin_25]